MKVTGQCYCGKTTIAAKSPRTTLYCHCDDCRRSAGAPVTAFVEFAVEDVEISGGHEKTVTVKTGVTRSFCGNCGSPVSGIYDYLPGMIYISLGLLDQAADLGPEMHAFYHRKYPWLEIADDLEKIDEEYRTD